MRKIRGIVGNLFVAIGMRILLGKHYNSVLNHFKKAESMSVNFSEGKNIVQEFK